MVDMRCQDVAAVGCETPWQVTFQSFRANIFLLRLTPAHFTFLMNKNETADAELQKALEDALQYYEEKISGDRELHET